jgi:hypothetical protein
VTGNEIDIEKTNEELRTFYGYLSDKRSVSERIVLLNKYEVDINKNISIDPKNPQLWFTLGRAIYVKRLVIPNLYYEDRDRHEDIMLKTVEAYRNAVKYTVNNAPKLTDDMLLYLNFFGEPGISVASGDLLLIKIKAKTYYESYEEEILDIIDMITNGLIELGRYDEIPEYRAILTPMYNKRTIDFKTKYISERIAAHKDKVNKINKPSLDIDIKKTEKNIVADKKEIGIKENNQLIEKDSTVKSEYLYSLFSLFLFFGFLTIFIIKKQRASNKHS